ncbi:dentin sialophosphoprotein [Biomphalaria glabrata]|nr:dentin sialophosphoprotein [Biomphalaria glabrata]
MACFKEITKKKRAKSPECDKAALDTSEERHMNAKMNFLSQPKTRKLSYEEPSSFESLIYQSLEDQSNTPLLSFNLNLDSGSWLLDDSNICLSNEEINGNKPCTSHDSFHLNDVTSADNINNQLNLLVKESNFCNAKRLQPGFATSSLEDDDHKKWLSFFSNLVTQTDQQLNRNDLAKLEPDKQNTPNLSLKNRVQTSQKNTSIAGNPVSGISIEQSYEANTDLTEYSRCSKNPGHKDFHAVDDLKVRNLPVEIQHEDSLTFFNCAAQLVVQISVFHTSPARGPKDMHSHYIGTQNKRNGSGFIASVDNEMLKFKCKKNACPLEYYSQRLKMKPSLISRSFSSPNGSEQDGSDRHHFYSGVYIHTNKHVIFDKSEAECAVVKFFFNSPDQTKVVYGHVTAIVGVNNSQDHVTLHVMSHDRNLFYIISCLLKDAKSSYHQMVKSTHKSQTSHGLKHSQSWVAVIAHAHGLSKAITFGHIKKEEEDGLRIVKYYDAATCPGSSGGLVMTPSLLKLQWPGAVHSACDVDTGFNVTLDSRVRDLDNQVIGQIHENLTRKLSESSFPSIEGLL